MGKKRFQSVDSYFMEKQSTEEMNRAKYFKVVHNYIQYYYKRADKYKKWYLTLSVGKFLVLAVIPVSQTLTQSVSLPWLAAGASSLCILLESVTELFRMKDKWILYRGVGNDLMSEERRYVMKAGVYQDEDEEKNFRLFVANAENIIGKEASSWSRLSEKANEEKA